ncbi:MAG TPA: DUF4149 domain-containing protein [Pyrinomonadaceae bacterium]|jgi:hypothetical protein|nr:DUF4149 domain-containing protein [Pyrinomonadaceae bacterium]
MEAKLGEHNTGAAAGNVASRARRAGEATAGAASAPSNALDTARLLLLGVWLGAAVFFSFAVAPSAFAVLPARELAGAIVTRTIGIVNVGGFLIALLLLLATAFARRRRGAATKRAWIVETLALALVALATATGHWVVAARMAALRVAMGRPIDEVAASDPLRLAFNSLHGYSVAAMTTAMLAAVVAFIMIARRNRN